MNKRQIFICICLFIVFFSLLSVASASDTKGNITVATVSDDDSSAISVTNNQDSSLGASPGSFTDLNNTISGSQAGESITLNRDYIYSTSDGNFSEGILIDKNIIIDGQGYTINAQKNASIFNIQGNSKVILKNINFINAYGVNGSAVNLDPSTHLEIINCNFTNNAAQISGGAIYVDNSSSLTSNLIIIASTFRNNTATYGGAVYLNENSNELSLIENSTFIDCTSSGDGGATFISANNVALKNVVFDSNVAGDDGGAIYWEGNNGIMENVTCTNNRGISADKKDGNTSSTRGGTICLTGDNVTVFNSKFIKSSAWMNESKNSSKVDGGALFVTGNDVKIIDCEFTDCNATNNGGALYVIGNNTQISNCIFKDNNASEGGALYVEGNDCQLFDSKFNDNTAGDDGGAIYWKGDGGVIYNSAFINNKGISATKPDGVNTSSTRGGSISILGDNVSIVKSNFTNSSAYIDDGKDKSKVDGGALFITGNNVKIIDSKFNNCRAVNLGGAIHIIGNYTQVLNCSFNDTKSLIGGAISISGNGAIVDNSLFRYTNASRNTLEEGGTGGAIYVEGSGTLVSNSDFAFANVINYGGAIAIWGENTNITNNVFANCSTTLYQGGAIFVNGVNSTISHSNFTRCQAKNQFAKGGAIEVSGDQSHIFDCNFDNCNAYFGGIIHVSGSDALIETSTLKDSFAVSGGAIYIYGSSATISNSNISYVTATFGFGGAIYVEGPNANISETEFLMCKVNAEGYHGGAIYISGNHTSIEKSNFTLCDSSSVLARGGAICIERGESAQIKDSNFDRCTAVNGGDIYVEGNYAIIEKSAFSLSNATRGGAIYLSAWGAIVKEANITECEASLNGGAIYVAGGGVNIAESNFEKCISNGGETTTGGGAIYVNGPDTHISTSNFNDNKVTDDEKAHGGTIYINGERTIIESSKFNESRAAQGGIIYVEGPNAVIDSCIFANSSSKYYGGAISVTGHNATIKLSEFENISATSNGGAIYVDGAETDILNSTFYKCSVSGDNLGGAIYINDFGTTVAFSNFTLSDAHEGGAIYIKGLNTLITYCNLDNNSAVSAGAIKVFGNNTILTNCNFTNNTALTGDGGALDIGGSNASVYYSWFDRNYAQGRGGAINWLGGHGDDSIIGSTFTNNHCSNTGFGGGAIYWTAGAVVASGGLIENSIFINNSAMHHGGAIDWFHAKDSVINNCLFINNTAEGDGGALYTGDQKGGGYNLTITNSQFYNNTAKKHGGAIANQMEGSWIYNNTFDGNKAKASGGSILMKEGPAKNSVIDHCYIYNSFVDQSYSGNVYGEGGGAIHIADYNITISNCAIINSTANKTYGGAIVVRSEHASLYNLTIQNVKTNDDNGGAIYWIGNSGTLNNVTIFNASSHTIDNNRAANGGAVFLNAANCYLSNLEIFKSSSNNDNMNCAKTNDGGAIYVEGNHNTLANISIDDSQALSVKMNTKGGAICWVGDYGTLVNATISNALANGQGGAIYWSGASSEVNNISITYSQTNVTNSINSADGGAIYSAGIDKLNNVVIVDAIASTSEGDIRGGAIYYEGLSMANVNVTGSRATTKNGDSYGGAIYWKSNGDADIYNSSFEANHADFGGVIYFDDASGNVVNTSFTGNVAEEGGAVYAKGGDVSLTNATFELNSAKRGGAIYTDDVQVKIDGSSFKNNTAEQTGGVLYHDYAGKSGSSYIQNTDFVNNTAFMGSAIFTPKFENFALTDVVLLDNQANANKFINRVIGVYNSTANYTSAILTGYDNILNSIWLNSTDLGLICSNVTYLGATGVESFDGVPVQSDQEVGQNVTVYMFNEKGELVNQADLVTDSEGKVILTFESGDGEVYNFAYEHKNDRYYTYLRETYSNSSLVQIWINNCTYGENASAIISLSDGAWGNLSGNVTVKLNDTLHTTFTVEIINSTLVYYNISGLAIGRYNATAIYDGNSTTLGDTDWCLFEVRPYFDLEIKKGVNITADYVNVTDIIEYTINVTNHGPYKAWDVNVTEILTPYLKLLDNTTDRGYYNLTKGTWFIGDLDVGENATLTIMAQVIHSGPITNTVWVKANGRDINLTNDMDSARNFTALSIVDLRIHKGVNVTVDVINVLDIIKFNITVFNDGPSNATGVIVEEILDYHLSLISNQTTQGTYAEGTWNIGDLAKGANATLTIVAQVIYSGNVSNAVHVSGFENETNYTNNYYAIKNITAVANVDLKITKEVNTTGPVNVTDKIKFIITVTNNGPCNATGVYVGEVFDYEHLRIISNETSDGHEFDGSTWVIGTLNKGQTHNLTIIAEVISSGVFSNFVTVTGVDNDTNKSNNNYTTDNITAYDIVDLEITKEVNIKNTVVNVSDVIEFTITVHNNGPCDATDVNVTEVLSSHLRMEDNRTDTGYYNVDKGVWYIGKLNNQSTAVLTIVARVISVGTIGNVVFVNSTQNDTNKSNNRDNITNITALTAVDLKISKTVNVTTGFVNVTDLIEFNITVSNVGFCNATNVNVTEVLNSHLRMVDNRTDYGHYDVRAGIWYIGNLTVKSTAVLTIIAKVMSNGTIGNVVAVNSTENDTNMSNNHDNITNITALNIVDLQINKTVNVTGEIDVTDKIEFTITVHNNGPCNATGVDVVELLSPILKMTDNITANGYYDVDKGIWHIGNLANGSDATLKIIAEINYSGVIENFVFVNSTEKDTNTSNNKDNITPIKVSAHVDLAINKTVNVTGKFVNVTDLIEFTITVTNYGPSNATGVVVTEPLDYHLDLVSYNKTKGEYKDRYTWDIGNVNVGEVLTLKIIARVMSPGNFTNAVNVTAFDNDTNKSNDHWEIDNITALPIVDLAITKEVNVTSGFVYYGDLIKFTINVTNNGPCDATGVVVAEPLDHHLGWVSHNATKGEYKDRYTWDIGTLTNQSTVSLTIIANVTSIGIISNVVVVNGTENDTNISNNIANITNITALPIVDVQINKTVNAAEVNVGDYVEYTINVVNVGPCIAHDVNVTEILSPLVKVTGIRTWVGTYDNSTNVWNIPELYVNVPVSLVLTVQVRSNGTIENVVTVKSAENDTNKSNDNYTSDNVTALPVVDLMVNKTVNVTQVSIFDLIEYTIVVVNNGPCNATGVNVTDKLDSSLEFVSFDSSRAGITYDDVRGIVSVGNLNVNETVVLTIVAKVTGIGEIPNVVNVTGNENDTNESNDNYTSDNVTALPVVDLMVNKTVNVTQVSIFDLIEYTIVVVNNGPCNATGVNVTDKLDSRLEFVSFGSSRAGITYDDVRGIVSVGNLDVNETVVLTIVAKIMSVGVIPNTVNVTGNENDTNESNDNYTSDNVTALPVVDLMVNKTVNVTQVSIFDLIEYTIVVVNNGPCNATGVNVTDKLDSRLEFVSFDSSRAGITYDDVRGIVSVGNLDVNETVVLTIVAKIMSVGVIPNTVNVTGNENDTNKSNDNYTSDNVTALSGVDLMVNKTVNVTQVSIFDLIEYAIVVVNNGPCNATGVNVTDKLDSRLEFVSFDSSRAGITYDDVSGIVSVGNLNVNETVVLTIVAKIMGIGVIPNTVNVTANENDTNKSNNNGSSQNVTALPLVDLKVIKTVDVTEAKIGDKISYTIKVQNNGPNDATNVNVTEKLSNYVTLVQDNATQGYYDATKNIWYIGKLNNGSIVTLTLTVQITQSGTIENSVIVNSTENDTNKTNNNYTSDNVTATKLDTPIQLTTYNITYGDDEILHVQLPVNATGTVNITVNDTDYPDVPINNGIVDLPVTDLAGGNYTVNVVYGGNDRYLLNSTSGIFNVARITPIITIQVEDIWVWQIEVLNVTVNAPGYVIVAVNGIIVEISLDNGVVVTDVLTATAKPDYKGNATWKISNLPAGTYPAVAFYPGNENYTSARTSDVFTVRDLIPTNVIVEADDIYVGEDAVINVVVGPKGVTGNVIVNVDGKNYTLPIKNGKATLTVPGLTAGDKGVTVWYGGNKYYLPSENATTFKVLKLKAPVDIVAPEITVGEDGVITVYVPKDATGTITIEIEGKKYTAEIKNGKAVFVVPGLKVGVHDIKAYYSGDDKYLPSNSTGEIKVNPRNNHNETNYTAKHHDGVLLSDYPTGNPIAVLLIIILTLGSCPLIRKFKK